MFELEFFGANGNAFSSATPPYRSLVVGPIEAIDGTPVIDIKPVIASSDS